MSGISLERVLEAGAMLRSVDDQRAESRCADAESERQERAYERAIRRNTGNVTPRCDQCGSFKSRPSDDCPAGNCGDRPLQHNATDEERVQYDQARGWYEPGEAR